MEFFEKIGKKASATYKTAAEKTNKIASETRLKLKINDNKSKVKDIYTQIGKKVYQKYVLDGGLDIKEDIKEEIERINELSDEIKEFEKQILELSDKKECIKCNNKIESTAKFCSFCGAEQPVEEAKEVEVINHSSDNDVQESATNTEEVISEIVVEQENAENNESVETVQNNDNNDNFDENK